MTLRTGTCHYVSAAHARRYYNGDLDSALAEGRVAVGRPHVPEGCTLRHDDCGRYWIYHDKPTTPAQPPSSYLSC